MHASLSGTHKTGRLFPFPRPVANIHHNTQPRIQYACYVHYTTHHKVVEGLSHPVRHGAQLLSEDGPEQLALLLEAEALVRHHLGHVRLAFLHVVGVRVVHGVAALPREVRHQQRRLLSQEREE